jgi:UDP-glucose 4-epimerase
MLSRFHNRKVVVTGGLGFIGSNLTLRLARAGARVTVIDSLEPGCGANRYNLAPVERDIRIVTADIGEAAEEVRGAEAVFNLAGEISHIHSMRNPARDAGINAFAQLRFLEGVSRIAPGIRVVYASTRQIYGAPEYLPVDELHPVRPVDFNGIHKYAATEYHRLFHLRGLIDVRVLCLTNVFGPRLALNVPGQGFLGNFLRKALLGETIEIFGDGRQLRDPVYVDDVADAFLRAAAADEPPSRLWNLGGAAPLPLAHIAGVIADAAGSPAPRFCPFPEEQKSIDIGSYTTDSTLIRAELGWHPQISFADGIRRTVEYYQTAPERYLLPQTAL